MGKGIKKNDIVKVLVGDCKGAEGKVLSVNVRKGRVVVEGLNKGVRHAKASQVSSGGRLEVEMPLDISNVAKVK